MKLMFDKCYRWSILRRVEILPSSISQPSGTGELLELPQTTMKMQKIKPNNSFSKYIS